MSSLSPLTPRRLINRQVEPTQQLVVFRLQQEWFALIIDVVQKVVPLGNVYGDVRGMGVSLTLYKDKELLVVDLGRRVFGEAEVLKHALPAVTEYAAVPLSSMLERQLIGKERYMLIVQTPQGELLGLPIDSPPALRRVPESAFAPLPPAYISQVHIQCVTSVVIQSSDEPPLFILNPNSLV